MAKKPNQTKAKKNVIVSYNKIDNGLKKALFEKYPEGYANYVIRYPKPSGEIFFAVPLETSDVNYLIKVEVKIDNLITEEDFDKHFGDIAEVDGKAIGEVEATDEDEEPDEDSEEENELEDDE